MRLKHVSLASGLVSFALALCVSCKKDDTNDNSNNNKKYGPNASVIRDMSYSNRAEISLGNLADSNASDPSVKAFGRMMIQDHQDAQNYLDTVAENRNVVLPDGLNDEAITLRKSLSSLSGREFDSVYINSQVLMHMKADTLFTSFRDSTTDQGLKNYVNKYLPGILKHLQKADSLANMMSSPSDTTDVPVDSSMTK
jgi:putative membrane protein